MLTIRLTRKGKKNQPFFRVVVIDKRRSSKGGRAVEDLGYVDPLTKRRSFKKDRILYWISKGAKPTPTIHNYLVTEKIIDAKKINVSKKSKKPVEAKPVEATPVAPATVPAVETPKEEAKPVEAVASPAPELAPAPVEKDLPAPKEEVKLDNQKGIIPPAV